MFTYDFIINHDKFSDFGYTLIVGVEYPEYLKLLHYDLHLLPEKMGLMKKKLTCTFFNRR